MYSIQFARYLRDSIICSVSVLLGFQPIHALAHHGDHPKAASSRPAREIPEVRTMGCANSSQNHGLDITGVLKWISCKKWIDMDFHGRDFISQRISIISWVIIYPSNGFKISGSHPQSIGLIRSCLAIIGHRILELRFIHIMGKIGNVHANSGLSISGTRSITSALITRWAFQKVTNCR